MGFNLPVLNRRRRTTRATSAFSPTSLFATGEQGYWLDPSDLTTMWQDHQGVTPVTATGQSVGLILDKRIGTRTQVFNDANVTFGGVAGYAGRVSSGVYQYARDASGSGSVFFGGLTAGRTYLISVQIAAYGGAIPGITSISADFRSALNVVFRPAVSAAGTYTAFHVADGTNFRIVSAFNGGGATISNVSILEVAGNHFVQATAASRPIYGIEPFGGRRNLLTFTEQFDNAVWTKNNATVSADSTTAPDGTNTADTITLTASSIGVRHLASASTQTRCYSFYVKNNSGARYFQILTDGTVNAFANFDIQAEVTGTRGSSVSASSVTSVGSGWYRIQMTATDASATNIYCALVSSNTAGWSVGASSGSFFLWGAQLELGSTATTYQRVTDQWNVTQAGVPSVSYLAFDGTDDFMVSNTITPGIDKAQVFAGLRKLSASTFGMPVDFGNLGTGSLAVQAPGASADNYEYYTNGTTNSTASASGYVAPITNVVSGLSDIASDSAVLRVNGAQVATSALDQGTGNYLAYPAYIGRRGGVSRPFNGRVYQMVTRYGPNLTAGQITQTENFTASKTGVYNVGQLNQFATLDASGASFNAFGAADADSNNYFVPKTVLAADDTPYSVL